MKRQQFVEIVRARLAGYYDLPVVPPHRDPLAELILTLLSQNTNDRNRDVAYLRLVDRFPSWEEVAAAPVEEIQAAIQPGGLSKTKSKRIKEIFTALDGNYNLDWLEQQPLEQARDFLCSLPGIGRKTAACVLLFSYGMPDIPVDTHVSRVGERLGLFEKKQSLERRHEEILKLTPEGAALELHVNLLRHGRRICAARKPLCERCVLSDICPAAASFT